MAAIPVFPRVGSRALSGALRPSFQTPVSAIRRPLICQFTPAAGVSRFNHNQATGKKPRTVRPVTYTPRAVASEEEVKKQQDERRKQQLNSRFKLLFFLAGLAGVTTVLRNMFGAERRKCISHLFSLIATT